jgi:hypothetical protein
LESKAQAFYYTGKDQIFNFIGGQTYTIYAWGGCGGYNNFNGNQNFGGYGAYISGVFAPPTSGSATVIVGRGGKGYISGGATNTGHSYGGGGLGTNVAADGGGRASIFVNTTNILTAGGGGGAGGNMPAGAAVGGSAGAAYSNGVFSSTGFGGTGNYAGGGATMSAGGATGGGSTSGVAGTGPATNVGTFQLGGDGATNGGGGGAGYYGGAGSGLDFNGTGGGGGGSSYINTNYFSCISAAQGSSIATSSSLSGAVQGLYTGSGYTAGTPSSANTGHALIIIVQNPTVFNPTYLPGCLLWMDAADNSTVYADSGFTTTATLGAGALGWKDKSGNGRNMTANSTVSYARYNGLPSLKFSGQYFAVSTSADLRQYTVFIVALSQGSTDNQTVFTAAPSSGSDYDSTSAFAFFLDTSSVNKARFHGGLLNSTVVNDNITAGTNERIPINIMCYTETSNATLNSYISGIAGSTVAGAYSRTNGCVGFSVGGEYSSSTTVNYSTSQANVFEILVYNTVFTTAQRRQVEMYLAWKWGIGTPLSTFSPANISGLALWMDGADSSTVILNGSNVTQWNDKSGKNYNVTGSSTTGITYSSNTLSFPGTSGGYLSNTTSGIPLRTLFMVCSAATDIILTASAAVNGQSQSGAYYAGPYATGVGASVFTTTFNGSGSGDTNQGPSYSGTSANTTYLHETTFDPSGQTVTLYINGANATSTTYSTSLTTKTPTGLFIGGNWYNNALNAKAGTFNEILMFNTVLTSAQRQQVEGYLAWKWGLQGNLSSSHPNRYTLPTSSPFSPLLIPGCSAWLDATDTSSITFSNSNVTQWNDKSQTGTSCSITGTSLPTLSNINSLNSVHFNSASSNLATINFASSTLSTNFTMFSVFVGTGGSTSFPRYFRLKTSGGQVILYQNSGLSEFLNGTFGTAVSFSGNTLVSWVGSSSTYFVLNGNTQSGSISDVSSNVTGLWVGGDGGNGAGSDFMTGDYGEIIFYNNALTIPQRQQVEGYLAWKWGLQSSLPSTHSYYKGSPASYITPTNILYSIPQDALSYLIMDISSKDYGTLPQTVTTNGTVTYTTIGGKKCAYFNNSTSNYLSFPFTPKTTLTICFWLYVIDSPYYTAVSITNSSINPSLQVDISNNSSVIPVAMPGQWTIVHNVSSSGPGQWCHYAVTINYTTFTSQAYINGSLSSTATGSSATGIAQTLFFLGKSGDNYRAFNGYLRQFLFYPRVLSAAEVSAIYTNTA